MRYTFDPSVQNREVVPMEFNKNSNREILQYAIGALLYMPGTNKKIVQKILNKEYPDLKAMVLCLEDSIGDCSVLEAERSVKYILSKLYEAMNRKNNPLSINELPLIFVRVREPEQMMRIAKACKKTMSVLTGFVWPKFDKSNANAYIRIFSIVRELVATPLYVMPIIESRAVMYKETRIENLKFIENSLQSITEYVLGIRVGGTDFSNLYSVRREIDESIWDVKVVSDAFCDIINIFGRNYVISGPVWEFFENPNKKEDRAWVDGLKKELAADRRNGMVGKTSIHPSQLRVIQESLMVSYSAYQNAIETLGLTNQSLVGVQKSFNGNQMNEAKTHINWARKTVCLARIYGVCN